MFELSFVITVIGISCVLGDGWVNTLDHEFTFQCPTGESISRIKSEHDNHAEDRRWSFECRPYGGQSQNCNWSGYQNDFDDLLEYHCPNSGFIHGIKSIHDNHHEDRRFDFYCCETDVCTPLVNCHDTGYINSYDGPMDFTLAPGNVLYGAVSVHDNGPEDRKWRLHICPCVDSNAGQLVG